jgi:Protein of unknown function (DUF3558)
MLNLPRSRPRLSAVLLVGLCFFVAACNSNKSASSGNASSASQAATGSTASPAATPEQSALPDPCALLTKAEAEEILGEPVRDPEANSLGGNRICDYKTVKVHGGVLPYSIHIAITPEKQNVWDAGKKLHTDAKELRPAPGLGDDAYFLLDDLQILSKERAININVMKAVDQPNHAKVVEAGEKAVAQKILPRLQ